MQLENRSIRQMSLMNRTKSIINWWYIFAILESEEILINLTKSISYFSIFLVLEFVILKNFIIIVTSHNIFITVKLRDELGGHFQGILMCTCVRRRQAKNNQPIEQGMALFSKTSFGHQPSNKTQFSVCSLHHHFQSFLTTLVLRGCQADWYHRDSFWSCRVGWVLFSLCDQMMLKFPNVTKSFYPKLRIRALHFLDNIVCRRY